MQKNIIFFFRFIIKLFTIQESAMFPFPTTVLWFYGYPYMVIMLLVSHCLSTMTAFAFLEILYLLHIVSRSHSTYPKKVYMQFRECIRLTVLICLQIRLEDTSTLTPVNYMGCDWINIDRVFIP